MIGRVSGTLATVLLLAACGSSDSGNGAAPVQAQRENAAHKKLLAASEVDRKLGLRRAVQDDGGSCPRIDGSSYQQEYEGMAMWIAHCSRGDWAVYVAPSGTIQARACKDAKALGLPECKPPEQAQAKSLPPVWSAESNPMPPPPVNEGR